MNGKQQQVVHTCAVLYHIDMVTNKKTELAHTFKKSEVEALINKSNELNRAHLDELIMFIVSYETRRYKGE